MISEKRSASVATPHPLSRTGRAPDAQRAHLSSSKPSMRAPRERGVESRDVSASERERARRPGPRLGQRKLAGDVARLRRSSVPNGRSRVPAGHLTADTTHGPGAQADGPCDVSAASMAAAFRAGHCTAHAAARGVALLPHGAAPQQRRRIAADVTDRSLRRAGATGAAWIACSARSTTRQSVDC